jgi:serine protein kinase
MTLEKYLTDVKEGKRRFENAFQSITRMILERGIEKTIVNGRPMYDFKFFREAKKSVVGMHEELNSLVSFIKDAAEGGSAKDMACVLVGEPGNGKTFLVDYLCSKYLNFVSRPENNKFTFSFNNLDQIGYDKKLRKIESQTFEDPMVLAMNIYDSMDENKEFLSKKGFSDSKVEEFFENYRPLGACSEFILNELKEKYDGDVKKILEDNISINKVLTKESLGVLIGKYAAEDKITASSVKLKGEESIERQMYVPGAGNPYKFDLRIGALARIGGGGIHFTDEIFKNKPDLVQVYLGVIQNRIIELNGYKWPLDMFIVGTSNNSEFNVFKAESSQSPVVDRCKIIYVGHNTNHKLQTQLTRYALGDKKKTSFSGESLHEDPNLVFTASAISTYTRLPHSAKLTPDEQFNLAAGETAGDKGLNSLVELIDELNRESDITKRFGQKGLSQRSLGRAIQNVLESSETTEGNCMYAYDVFKGFEKVILDNPNQEEREKYLEDLDTAKGRYREKVMEEVFNAYMDDPSATRKDVLGYVNMVVGSNSNELGENKMWSYKDPQTGEAKAIKVDESYMNSVESQLGHKSKEQINTFRATIRDIYAQKNALNKNYDFMDNSDLVRAIVNVKINSDVGTAKSLVGALSNRTDEENEKIYNRMLDVMVDKLNYCPTCAEKTIEYFCTPHPKG